jgi:hypothetical protein
MPTISTFYGIAIQMFYTEHAPAHFHAKYGEFLAVIDINRGELVTGKLPRRALNLVLDWANLHREELLQNWELCRAHQRPKSIAPLE